jgi:putative thioredoxin
MKDVIEESKRQPVLVDFWAPWCGPCKQLTPILEKAVKAAKGAVKLAKMNIDEHPAIPGQMGIQSLPAVIAFVNGQPADGFMGALPESQVNAFLERLTKGKAGTEAKDLPKTAEEALAGGDSTAAAEIYAQLLTEDGGNVAALAGLARCYVTTGALDQAKQTPWCQRQSATTPRSLPPAPRSNLPNRQNPQAPWTNSNARSPPIHSIIRRGSISPSRSTPKASAPKRSII